MANPQRPDWIIDTDTHVTEPPDLWTSRISRKWGDAVLHVAWHESLKSEWWFVGDTPIMPAWVSANWGWDGPPGTFPSVQSEAHPAAYVADARLKVMNDSGISAAVLYPNLGFAALPMFQKMGASELMLESVTAYNDFILEWSSAAPKRLLPMAILPVWDVEASVREIQRVAKLGHKGICTTATPEDHGQPELADSHWDPMWAAAQDAGLSINFHGGAGGSENKDEVKNIIKVTASEAKQRNYVNAAVTSCLVNGMHLSALLTSGILVRFPSLKFAIVESGVGWIPFMLEAVDYHFEVADMRKESPEFREPPSYYFRRQVYINYWFEKLEQWHIDAIGADNLLFETDFPHPTCLYGKKISATIESGLRDQDAETRQKILWRNASKLYHVEMPREAAA